MAASVGEPSISNTAGVGGMQAAAGFAGSDRNFTLARCATPLLSLARNAATASLGTAMSIAGCCGGPVAAGRRTSEPGVDPVDAKALALAVQRGGCAGSPGGLRRRPPPPRQQPMPRRQPKVQCLGRPCLLARRPPATAARAVAPAAPAAAAAQVGAAGGPPPRAKSA
eukprot:CAMPEP_0170275436 /NCGR_PEP_ID=MMETSP0116_2-20130129/37698_1 /TAXON_ID=400756 /ORGANISM="Durinskia baltica, Strain CSIRO CS-38" /LENGTH=167 /DNA_ID=CAMNT_0010526699 /DNA_START=89 /DNA_END=589 /DNA_ORIENTATION=-